MSNSRSASIMALPHAQHPRLAPIAKHLADDPRFDVETAKSLLKAAADDAGISKLDLEMCQPQNSVRIPFSATRTTSPGEAFQETVQAMLDERIPRKEVQR